MGTQIYLDNNATTPLDPQVAAAMVQCAQATFANPSSQHRLGQRARQFLDEAKDSLAGMLGGGPKSRLIITSGGTEANNLALFGLWGFRRGKVLISAIEHPSVSGAAAEMRRRGIDVGIIGVDRHGRIDEEGLAAQLSPDVTLVSVMFVNNETGAIQPIQAIAQRCRTAGIMFHTDAVQAVGKVPFRFDELGIDALTFSAHKLHGPAGVGGLLLRDGLDLSPILFGGQQQLGIRPGTESLPLMEGCRKALEIWLTDAQSHRYHLKLVRDDFESRLRVGLPEIVIHSAGIDRAPHTTCASFPGLERQSLLMALDMAGIACSTGSACASGSSEPSAVLTAMGVPSEQLDSALRFTFSRLTTAEEVVSAASRIIEVCKALQHGERRRKVAGTPPHSSPQKL